MKLLIIGIIILGVIGVIWYMQSRSFTLPSGETISTETTPTSQSSSSSREILVTDGVKHSIPLDEILSGGPGKDGIPSIDNPKFVSTANASFLNDSDPGLGLSINGEVRFYPYRILVWHEIVNDTVAGKPVLVTYCPLCATGIVFERKVGGEVQEFGVSGRLWQSNLLMYNRAERETDESLWSQVLGEAVLGMHTGKKLPIIRSDVVRFGDWKSAHPDTKVLSQDTGAARDYGRDPYGDYYTSESVSFGATFSDTRLHPKALVHGIEIDGQYKAYSDNALFKTITDTFAGKNIAVTKTDSGEITFTANGEVISSIPGFWFSWLAVHPETELYK
ncbi:MAG: DUF3179 domain-containing protein [Candidatus Zambryskibacteria bacterium]|nr:DUF3179 domain-containing protein [Candidatus Zambryskibacteria bacterium]